MSGYSFWVPTEEWSKGAEIFKDRRTLKDRRNRNGFPAHLSFSLCRRTNGSERRRRTGRSSDTWWLSTNYVNWEADIKQIRRSGDMGPPAPI